jgi:hypothetical protein
MMRLVFISSSCVVASHYVPQESTGIYYVHRRLFPRHITIVSIGSGFWAVLCRCRRQSM